MTADLIIRTVDRATAALTGIADRIRRLSEPLRRLRARFRALADAGGLDRLVKGFKGVGSGVSNVAGKAKEVLGKVGGAAGVATLALGGFVNAQLEAGDALGEAAARAGLTADEYQNYAYAADKAGVSQEKFGAALDAFYKSIGEAKLEKGKLAAFFKDVSPSLLKDLNRTKNTAGALEVVLKKIAKIKNGSVRAAVAARAFGSGDLAQLVANGFGGLQADLAESALLGGSAGKFVEGAGVLDEEMNKLRRTLAGVSQSVSAELFPAFAQLAKVFRELLVENKEQIKAWAKEFGEKLLKFANELPQRLERLKAKFSELKAQLAPLAALFGGFGNLIGVVAGLIVGGPLIAAIGSLIVAFVSLGVAMGATPFGLMIAGIAALVAAGVAIYKNWEPISAFFIGLWDDVKGAFKGFMDWLIGAFTLDFDRWWRGIKQTFSSIGKVIEKLSLFTPAGLAVRAVRAIKDRKAEQTDGESAGERTGTLVNRTPLLGAQAARPQAPPRNVVERRETRAQVTVDFRNVPRGTQIAPAAGSTADLGLNVGYIPEMGR